MESNWRTQAACVGRHGLFDAAAESKPGRRDGQNRDAAQATPARRVAYNICRTCPVLSQCYKDVLETGDAQTFRAARTPRQLHTDIMRYEAKKHG